MIFETVSEQLINDENLPHIQHSTTYEPYTYFFDGRVGYDVQYMNKEELIADGEAGKRALELVLAIYKSAAEGKPVKLPLKECSTMDFVGRFTD